MMRSRRRYNTYPKTAAFRVALIAGESLEYNIPNRSGRDAVNRDAELGSEGRGPCVCVTDTYS